MTISPVYKMNPDEIRRLALELERVAKSYASHDREVDSLLVALSELICSAIAGTLSLPMDDIPGSRLFQDGGLGKYKDLELAYSQFKLAVTMSDLQLAELREWAATRRRDAP